MESDRHQSSDPMGVEEVARKHRRGRMIRHAGLFVLLLACGGLVALLMGDYVTYFLGARQPRDLGHAEDWQIRSLTHNEFVQVQGIARDMCIRSDTFSGRSRYFYLLGSELGARVLIQTTDSGPGCQGAVDRKFSGRLVDLRREDRYRAVLDYYLKHFAFAPRQGPYYLLEDGVLPQKTWYVPAVIALLWLLAGYHAFRWWRLFRMPAGGI
jgi:hypothetical protein